MKLTDAQLWGLQALGSTARPDPRSRLPHRFPAVGRCEDLPTTTRQTAMKLIEMGFAEASRDGLRWDTPPGKRMGFYIRITEAGRQALESEAAR